MAGQGNISKWQGGNVTNWKKSKPLSFRAGAKPVRNLLVAGGVSAAGQPRIPAISLRSRVGMTKVL
jgi:hypothetical protein